MNFFWKYISLRFGRRSAPAGYGGTPANGRPLPPEPQSFSPLLLAYVGDAVYELYIRTQLAGQGNARVADLHRSTVRYVQAQAQAERLREIEPLLTAEEREIVRRGRNAKPGHTPKSTDVRTYHRSTAFEALLGYLYLSGQTERMQVILAAAENRP